METIPSWVLVFNTEKHLKNAYVLKQITVS